MDIVNSFQHHYLHLNLVVFNLTLQDQKVNVLVKWSPKPKLCLLHRLSMGKNLKPQATLSSTWILLYLVVGAVKFHVHSQLGFQKKERKY
jgi:hypothetical protein